MFSIREAFINHEKFDLFYVFVCSSEPGQMFLPHSYLCG